MEYRRQQGVPGKVLIESHGLGSWYKNCVGKTYDVLIPKSTSRAYIVMDTAYNRSILPDRLMGRIPEDVPQGSGLTILRKYAKVVEQGLTTNESASGLLKQNDWLF